MSRKKRDRTEAVALGKHVLLGCLKGMKLTESERQIVGRALLDDRGLLLELADMSDTWASKASQPTSRKKYGSLEEQALSHIRKALGLAMIKAGNASSGLTSWKTRAHGSFGAAKKV